MNQPIATGHSSCQRSCIKEAKAKFSTTGRPSTATGGFSYTWSVTPLSVVTAAWLIVTVPPPNPMMTLPFEPLAYDELAILQAVRRSDRNGRAAAVVAAPPTMVGLPKNFG